MIYSPKSAISKTFNHVEQKHKNGENEKRESVKHLQTGHYTESWLSWSKAHDWKART